MTSKILEHVFLMFPCLENQQCPIEVSSHQCFSIAIDNFGYFTFRGNLSLIGELLQYLVELIQ